MKTVFFETSMEEQSIFTKLLASDNVSFFKEKLDEKNVEKAKDADVVCIFVKSAISKDVIDALPNLKFVATRSTGFDHINCEYAKTKGIKVANVSSYGSHTVAEFTFGLLLNLSRNIIKANNHIKETSDFNYSSNMEGFNLQGKTIGVIGTGKIGKNVIKIAKGFQMNVLAYDLYPDLSFAKENNFEYKNLEEVLKESDILTLHAPSNKENIHLINKEKISIMKKGVYLINTARGELIETEALVFGLENGTIAGFGADVLEGEKFLKEKKSLFSFGKINKEDKKLFDINKRLMQMPNVIITPHVAFYTYEAVDSIQKTTIENIQAFISGSPVNIVN